MRRVTIAKAEAARARLVASGKPASPVLVADTTVTIDGAILGKPADADDALAMLTRLAGREHAVLTAVAVIDADGELLPPALSRSSVRSRPRRAARTRATSNPASRSARPAHTRSRGAPPSSSRESTGPIQVSWVCPF